MVDQFSIEKTPDAILDYGFNWSKWLTAGDALQGATWTISPIEEGGLVIIQNLPTPTHSLVWFGGGILGTTYQAKCKIVTQEGREDARILFVTITYDKG